MVAVQGEPAAGCAEAGGRGRRAAGDAADSTSLRFTARMGLVARAVFYLVLAYLAVVVARHAGSGGQQSDANGAMRLVAANPLGKAVLLLAVLGFLAFGASRLLGAFRDRRPSRLRRLSTAGQGLWYLVMAALVGEFLLGKGSVGSEQQHDSTTATLLSLPGGRWVVAGVGVVVVCVCGWQVLTAIRGQYADGLRLSRLPAALRAPAHVVARVGIPARALAVAPVGVFFVLAGVEANAGASQGLDAYLSRLARHPSGRVVVLAVAVGFVVFALYSLVEARCREVAAGV
ncbi:MAG: DUF1206 domain-containing protein [Motilibacteraceae bacterium]